MPQREGSDRRRRTTPAKLLVGALVALTVSVLIVPAYPRLVAADAPDVIVQVAGVLVPACFVAAVLLAIAALVLRITRS